MHVVEVNHFLEAFVCHMDGASKHEQSHHIQVRGDARPLEVTHAILQLEKAILCA